MFIWSSGSMIMWILEAVKFGTVILLGSLGEIITEKSGHLNLGIPGVMYLGGIAGFAGVYYYGRTPDPNPILLIVIGLACAFAAGALGGLIYSFLTVTLRTNQNVTGLTLTTFGAGFAKFFGIYITKQSGETVAKATFAKDVFDKKIPFLSDLGVVGEVFFSYGFLIYLTLILSILVHIFLFRTKTGLNLRSVGENPATADAAGINVSKYKYLATCIGCGISGIGGLQYVIKADATWSTALDIEGMGWLAVALVIFATWKPANAIWGAYLFGFLYKAESFYSYFLSAKLPTYYSFLWRMTPYIVTIVVLVIASFRKKKESQPPAALGLPYFREER